MLILIMVLGGEEVNKITYLALRIEILGELKRKEYYMAQVDLQVLHKCKEKDLDSDHTGKIKITNNRHTNVINAFSCSFWYSCP